MARASKVCGTAGCPNLQPCEAHAPKPWATSTRRERTVSGWEQQRRAKRVIARDQGICHVCHEPGATVCDHIIPLAEGGPDNEDNLAAIHHHCHHTKTEAEAKRGRQ